MVLVLKDIRWIADSADNTAKCIDTVTGTIGTRSQFLLGLTFDRCFEDDKIHDPCLISQRQRSRCGRSNRVGLAEVHQLSIHSR